MSNTNSGREKFTEMQFDKSRTKKIELQQKTIEQNMVDMIALLEEAKKIREDINIKNDELKRTIESIPRQETLEKAEEDPVFVKPVKGYDLSLTPTKDVLYYWKIACDKYSGIIERRDLKSKPLTVVNLGKVLYQEIRDRGIDFVPEQMNMGSRRLYNVVTQELGVWNTKYVNTLPDSSFAFISPGGKKDDEGKTTPRSLRHLPFKDENGKVDVSHVRNALARLKQTHIPDEAKTEALHKLKAAAASVGVEVSKEQCCEPVLSENVNEENETRADN